MKSKTIFSAGTSLSLSCRASTESQTIEQTQNHEVKGELFPWVAGAGGINEIKLQILLCS
jgi:hypothetical protein